MATRVSPYYYPKADADALCQAIVALDSEGADRDAALATVAGISTKLPWYHRYRLADYSKIKHGNILLLIRAHSKGVLRDALFALYKPAAERDAEEIHDAMDGVGTHESALRHIICTRLPHEIDAISVAYEDKYGRAMVDDVAKDLHGKLKDLLVKLLTEPRRPNGPVDQAAAAQTAQELYDAGKGKWGTDEEKFIQVMATESLTQLKAIFDAYKAKFGHSIFDAVEDEFEGTMERDILILALRAYDPALAFARLIHRATKKMGTAEDSLIRTILCRVDIDLPEIVKAFQTTYNESIIQRLEGESQLCDDLKVLLVTAIRNAH